MRQKEKAQYLRDLNNPIAEEAIKLLQDTFKFLAFQYLIGTNYGGNIGWAFTYDADMRQALLKRLEVFEEMSTQDMANATEEIRALKAKKQSGEVS